MVQLQKALPRFQARHLNVAAITYDNATILKDFAERRHIQYSLMSDADSRIIRAFGIVDPDESPGNLPEFAKKGMALAGYFFVGRDGVVKEKYFGGIYYDRYTPNNVIAKLFPELLETTGNAIKAAHLELVPQQSDEDVVVGSRISLGVSVTLPPGVHVYALNVKNYKPVQLLIDSFDTTLIDPKLLKESRYPSARTLLLPAIKERVPIYEKRFQISQDLMVVPPADVQKKLQAAGMTTESSVAVIVQGRLKYQACDASVCYPPEEVKITWPLRVHRMDSTRSPEAIREKRSVTPCSSKPEYKQFDFWLGDWVVTSQDQQVATSSIQRIIEGCVIYENYTQADGYSGKSFNFYDANLQKWRQTWVDVAGRVSEFAGDFKDGAMRFSGESHLADGTKVLRHMTLFNLAPNKVRQLSEVSRDDGKTWAVNYDFIYKRK